MKKLLIIFFCVLFTFVGIKAFARQQQFITKNFISNPNLVSLWNFNGADGSDYLGRNNGTVSNVSFGNQYGLFGTKGLYSAGAQTDYISIPDSATLDPLNTLTINCWVYPIANSGAGFGPILFKQNTHLNDFAQYDIEWENSKFTFVLAKNGTVQTVVTQSGTSPANAWYMVTATYNNPNMVLYVNGTNVGTGSFTGPMEVSTNPVYLMSDNNAASFNGWLNGYLEDCIISSSTVNAATIADWYTFRSLEGNGISR